MDATIQSRLSELEPICRRRGVRRLELFGSAATAGFDPTRSDVDFLVELAPDPPGGPFDAFMGLKEDLEALLGRSVDLVSLRARLNPYFLESIAGTRTVVYAA